MLKPVLLVMTILMAVVGSIGLSGTLSINVLERTREIGVMRALGASSLAVSLIFIGEGLMLGIVSWMIGMPLGYAVAPAFVSTISNLINLPILYFPSLESMGIWLAVVVTLSVLASWAPARRATRISVNESLAYE